MPEQAEVSRHYTHGRLIDAISGGHYRARKDD
jgi:hypothetical protein